MNRPPAGRYFCFSCRGPPPKHPPFLPSSCAQPLPYMRASCSRASGIAPYALPSWVRSSHAPPAPFLLFSSTTANTSRAVGRP